ncbi:MAG: outer membrane protein [Flammeovirgaceae bacterium]
MKNLTLLFSIGALLLSSFVFYKGMSNDGGTTASVPANGMVAFIDMDSLEQNYKYFLDLKADLQNREQQISSTLQKEATSLGADEESFVKQAKAGIYSNNQMKQKQQELMERKQKLQQDQYTYENGLVSYSQEKQKDLYDKISTFLKEYNKEKGYSYIMQHKEYGGMLLLTDPGHNITAEVIEGLNAKYETENKEEEEVTK